MQDETSQRLKKIIATYDEERAKALSDDEKITLIVKFVQRIYQLSPFLPAEHENNIKTCYVLLNKLLRDHNLELSLLMNVRRFDCCSVAELVEMVKQGQRYFQRVIQHTEGDLILQSENEIPVLQSIKCSPKVLPKVLPKIKKDKALISTFIKMLKINSVVPENAILPNSSVTLPNSDVEETIVCAESIAENKIEPLKLEENTKSEENIELPHEEKLVIEAEDSSTPSNSTDLGISEEIACTENTFSPPPIIELPMSTIGYHAEKSQEPNLLKEEVTIRPYLEVANQVGLHHPNEKKKVSTEKNRNNNPSLTPIKENYVNFINYLQSVNSGKTTQRLAGWDTRNRDYYFVESNESKRYAELFLKLFLANPNNKKMIIDQHLLKVARLITQNKAITVEQFFQEIAAQIYNDIRRPLSFFPSCLAFIAATIEGKKYCFIASSVADTDEPAIFHKLKETVEAINQTSKDVEFILLGGKISYFNEVFRSIIGKSYSAKGCAEKYYIKFLTKLYIKFGDTLEVNGIANCSFYPYLKNESYGDRAENPINQTVRPFSSRSPKLELDKQTFVILMRTCPSCTENKKPVERILTGARAYSTSEWASVNRSKRELSPVRNSIISNTSFLSFFSTGSLNPAGGKGITAENLKQEVSPL